MKPGTTVVVSRRWNNPTITIDVTADEIAIAMPIEQFLEAAALEVGNPVGILTGGQLRNKLLAAAEVVIDAMKQETRRVIR